MTEDRKDELRAVLQSKQRNADHAAIRVLEALASAQTMLDPSENALMFSQVLEALKKSERQVKASAEDYELREYGLELLNIDGQRDEPFAVVDQRSKPSQDAGDSDQTYAEQEIETPSFAETRTRLSSFGAATGLIFEGSRGSVEIALAPLELRRVLDAWSVYELSSKETDAEVMRALHLLMEKSYEKAPGLIAEVPIASSGKAALVPDHSYRSQSNLRVGEQ